MCKHHRNFIDSENEYEDFGRSNAGRVRRRNRRDIRKAKAVWLMAA